MKKFIIPAALLLPMLASAQSLGNLYTLLQSIGRLVSLATPIVLGIALLGFFWGLMRFIFAGAKVDQRKEGRNFMIWAAAAFFVMVSIWGIVRFIGTALGINQEQNPITVPRVPGF